MSKFNTKPEADLSSVTQMVFFLALGKYLFGPFTPTDNREENIT
jgi:hypothetical protein